MVLPPKPVDQRPTKPSVDEAEEALVEAGWEKAGYNDRGDSLWADPLGQGPKSGVKVEAVRLQSKEGGEPQVIKQTRCGPAPWNYPLMEAMLIQRDRDRAAPKEAKVIVTN